RGGNARAESRPGQVRVGRVSERLQPIVGTDHVRRDRDRFHRLRARSADDEPAVARFEEPDHMKTVGPILSLSAVTKAYQGQTGGQTQVLGGIDLDVEEGEFIAILGFSGAGKTTLINAIAGLERPDGGKILL